MVVSSRYLNFHGQKGARIANDQTIYGIFPERTYLIKTLSILFFYTPELYLKGTHGRRTLQLYTEKLLSRAGVCLHGLCHLSAQVGAAHHTDTRGLERHHLKCEYSLAVAPRYDLYAPFRQGTVLLTANMAFLAIPSVDNGTRARTPTQVASYFSTVTSIGSIVIGLLLVRKHRDKPNEFADEVVSHFTRSLAPPFCPLRLACPS